MPHCTLLSQTPDTTAFSKGLFLQLCQLVPFPHAFCPIKACGFNFVDKSFARRSSITTAMTTRTWRAQSIYEIVQAEHNDSQMFITAGTEECTAIANSPFSTAKQF